MGVISRKFIKLKVHKVDSLSTLSEWIPLGQIFYYIMVLFFISIPGFLSAQNNFNDITVKKNGKKYYRHIVGKGETIYGIAEKFNEQPKDVIFENPSAMDGIHPGDTLMIPILAKVADTTSVNGNYIYHDVSGKETLYSLSKRYNTTVGAIDSLNPGLAGTGLKTGQRIRIPNTTSKPLKKHGATKDTVHLTTQGQTNGNKNEAQAYKNLLGGQSPANNPQKSIPTQPGNLVETMPVAYSDTGKKMSRYNIALIMPFAADRIDTLRLYRLLDGTEQIPLITQISVDFYHGVIMAFDSLARRGFKVNLHVYNISSGSDTSSYAVDSILKKPELAGMNLIVGPPYPTNFSRVARFAGLHHIPAVSPLSPENSVLKNNPWTSKLVPSPITETEQEADFIASHYNHNNIIVIHDRNASQLYYETFKKRFHATDSALGNHDSLRPVESIGGVNALAGKISNTLVNIIVVPYQGAPFVAKFVNELANSHYARKDSLLFFGMHNWANNDALAPENLDTLGFHFPSNEYINYTDISTKNFILKYREVYLSEPSRYSYEGYDAAMFYGNLLNTYGTDIQQHLGDTKYKGLQTSFNMIRISPSTGYENRAVYILEYNCYTEKPDTK